MAIEFIGTFKPLLDDKGRLILPTIFRDDLADGLVITKGPDRCLVLYTSEEFSEEARELREAERTAAAGKAKSSARTRLRKFTSNGARDAPDRQGRITVPPALREYAGLHREVAVVGSFNRVEVWDRATFEALESSTDDHEEDDD